jgi:hypothetical protein
MKEFAVVYILLLDHKPSVSRTHLPTVQNDYQSDLTGRSSAAVCALQQPTRDMMRIQRGSK